MHRHNGREIAPERHYTVHPADEMDRETIEEMEDLREKFRKDLHAAHKQYVWRINAFAAHVEAAILRPGSTKQDIAVAFYQAAYGVGSNICEGVTMTRRSEMWDVERATISKGAVQFTSGNNMPPSFYMKAEESRGAYAKRRIESIEENQ